MATTLAELLVVVGADLKDFNKGMAQVERAMTKTLGTDAMAASRSVVTAFSVVGAAMGALGAASIGLAADMEQNRIAFTTLLGSAQKADTFLRQMEEFAARTPFQFNDLLVASKHLLAVGFAAKDVMPIMTTLGDAVAGLGGGAEMIDRVTNSLGQMRAKGKVSAEEMRELAKAGIPAWQMLADAIGTTVPGAMKKAEEGAISSAVAIPAILAGMNAKFGGLMEAQSHSLEGMWSNTKDSLAATGRIIGANLIQAFDLKGILGKANALLEEFTTHLKSGGIREAINAIIPESLHRNITLLAGAIMGAMVPALAQMALHALRATVPLLPFIAAGVALAAIARTIAKAWDEPIVKLGVLATTIGLVAVAITQINFAALLGGIAKLVPGLNALITAAEKAGGAVALLAKAMTFLAANPIILIVAGLAAATIAVAAFINAQKRAQEEQHKQAQSLVELSSRYGQLTQAMNDSGKSEAERKAAGEEQKRIIQEIGDAFPGLVKKWDDHGKAVSLDTDKLRENTVAARANVAAANEAALAKNRDALKSLVEQRQSLQEEIVKAEARGNAIVSPGGKFVSTVKSAAHLRDQLAKINEQIETTAANMDKLHAQSGNAPISNDRDISSIALRRAQQNAQATRDVESQAAADATADKKKYLEEFDVAFSRANDKATTDFDRSVQDQTEAFKHGQEDQLAAFEHGQEAARTTFERAQQDKLATFEQGQSQEKTAYERHQQDLLTAFERRQEDAKRAEEQALQDRLDRFKEAQAREKTAYERHQQDLLNAFKDRQSDELEALRKRQDAERAAVDKDYAAKVAALKGQQDAIKDQQEIEQTAKRREELAKSVHKAQEELGKALAKGDLQAIADAQERVGTALEAQVAFETDLKRKGQLEQLQDQMDALRTQKDLDLQALKDKQDAQKKGVEESQTTALQAYQRELEDEKTRWEGRQARRLQREEAEIAAEKLGFDRKRADAKKRYEQRLADDKTAFEERQAERKKRFAREQADQLKAYDDQQKAALKALQDRQADEFEAWNRAQEDRKTRYKQELEDLKTSFEDKHSAQQRFIADWNAGVASLAAMVPPVAGPSLPVPSATTSGSATTPFTPIAAPSPTAAAQTTPVTAQPVGAPLTPGIGKLDQAAQLAQMGAIEDAVDLVVEAFPDLSRDQARQNIVDSLPHLASGAIATRPTLAVVGDSPDPQGEGIIPLSDLWERMSAFTHRVAATVANSMPRPNVSPAIASTGANASGAPMIIQQILDGRVLAESMIRHQPGALMKLGVRT
ncbi:MAG TPA: tape measure protein [Symbiobacteriaceae bacterium]|jgi:tape measure domain-containing protein